ncbi:hypothetical protein Acsp03_05210 [Actinomadura sp. NBRC 104412]|uniref:glycosyltransferase n=1 Tax=Actinomadura sp. NBRC 104412 TaxID=3032203 RepID=UPI0024A11223|nr:glycosyltransferase [Actinomadura sp. NBRC 104412]GLZ03054.1 hypothetical protein Acsp03_05210 [Actinomadura sp. NBRC 104412]
MDLSRERADGTGGAADATLEIVVPCRNEAARLPHGLAVLCARLRTLPVRSAILVVDNASTDATARIARSWPGPIPVRVLRCARRGKGAAVRAGLLATSAPYVGFCDADMATDVAAVGPALALLRAGRPVVIGARRHPGSAAEPYRDPMRRAGALVFNRLVRDLAGGVADTQCGFKFFDGPLARSVAAELRITGYVFDAEVLMRCVRRGAAITELPVVWRDAPGTAFSPARHAAGCVRDLVRLRLSALRSRVPASGAGVPSTPPPEAAALPPPALRRDPRYGRA